MALAIPLYPIPKPDVASRFDLIPPPRSLTRVCRQTKLTPPRSPSPLTPKLPTWSTVQRRFCTSARRCHLARALHNRSRARQGSSWRLSMLPSYPDLAYEQARWRLLRRMIYVAATHIHESHVLVLEGLHHYRYELDQRFPPLVAPPGCRTDCLPVPLWARNMRTKTMHPLFLSSGNSLVPAREVCNEALATAVIVAARAEFENATHWVGPVLILHQWNQRSVALFVVTLHLSVPSYYHRHSKP
jgi:hypothetical protein